MCGVGFLGLDLNHNRCNKLISDLIDIKITRQKNLGFKEMMKVQLPLKDQLFVFIHDVCNIIIIILYNNTIITRLCIRTPELIQI